MDFLTELDRNLFLAINGWYSPFFDTLMYWLSQKFIWAPLYAVLLFMIWKVYRKGFLIALPLIVLMVTLTDQVSVLFFKDVFERLRPCHDPALEGLVRIIRNHCGGSYGFISSHASNTFGVAVFSGTVLRIRYKWVLPVLLFWASAICYSRVYLGVHFPGDVIVGAIVGAITGYLIVLLFYWLIRKMRMKHLNVSPKTKQRESAG
ncbi:MAG TPA: phosphatase PAP2 family protein [Lentimicrobium sp.]|nr:phosphatase PAP2 family protein [Lentimicrobium sp.]